MKLSPINSSMIVAAGYDADLEAMQVQFKNGQVFEYSGVTEDEFEAALEAKSFGAHFAKHIKPGHDAKPVPPAKPKCKVDGVLAPNAMCGRVTVKGGFCSAEGECEHKEAVSND